MTDQPPTDIPNRFGITTLVKVLVVAGCALYVVWGLDSPALIDALFSYRGDAALGMFMFSCVAYIALGGRLHYLLSGRIGFGSGIAAGLLALGLNNILPARLGEIAKVVYLQHRTGDSIGATFCLVFWERLADVNMLALLALGTFWWHGKLSLMVPMAGGLIGLWCGIAFLSYWSGPATALIARIPIVRLRHFFHDFHDNIRTGLTASKLLILAIFTVTLWSIYAGQTILALMWVAQLPITLDQALLVFAMAAVGVALPSSPGGLGVFEAIVILSLSWFGVDKESALAAALMCRVVLFLPPTLISLGLLLTSDISLRGLRNLPSDNA